MRRRIRTLAGLQRAFNAKNKRLNRFYGQPYILGPALARNLARYDELNRLDNPSDRFKAFRLIPALEYDLDAINATLTRKERTSFAQRYRARYTRVRLTKDGATITDLVREVVLDPRNPEGFKAKEYWAPFVESLGRRGLNPTFANDPVSPQMECVEYDARGARRRLGRRQFENIVSKIRRLRHN
jgi:hypothetical protein